MGIGMVLSNNFNNNFPPKNNLIRGPINSAIEKAKLEYLKSLEPMATRKCSEKYLEIVSKDFKFNWRICRSCWIK